MKKAFSMIELVFIIVIIGVLASIAVPKFIVNTDDAKIVRIKTDIAVLRSQIAQAKNQALLLGQSGYPKLETIFKNSGISGGYLKIIGSNPNWLSVFINPKNSTETASTIYFYDQNNGTLSCDIKKQGSPPPKEEFVKFCRILESDN